MLRQLGRFTVGSMVSSDAVSEVWRGEDGETGNTVAIRLLREVRPLSGRQLTEYHGRFLDIAAIGSTIDHPAVVEVLEFDIRGGMQPYLVLEFILGTTLVTVLDDGPLPPAQVAAIGCHLAAGLAAGHREGLVHGDVRPSNLLRGEDEVVKLTEFGVARLAERTYTEPGRWLSSPAYCAPELVNGEPTTPASDVFSLGATLYTLLCGIEPFVRGTLVATARAVVEDQPPAPSTMLRDLPGTQSVEWSVLLGRALAKAPADRIATMEELAAALEPLRQG